MAGYARAADVQFTEAIRLFQNQNYAASRDLLRKLTKVEPRKALYWFNLGNAYYMLEDFRGAETSFHRVERLGSTLSPAARLYRAKALRGRGAGADARVLLNSLIGDARTPPNLKLSAREELSALDDESPDAVRQQALADYQGGRYRAALAEVDTLRDPDGAVLLLKGLILTKLNRINEAEDVARQVPPGAGEDRQKLLRAVIAGLRNEFAAYRPFWLLLDGALGYDTNPYYETQAADPNAAAAMKLAATAGGKYWKNAPWFALASVRFDWNEFKDAGDLKSITQFAQTSLVRESPGDSFVVGVTGQQESWANQQSLRKFGGRVQYRRFWSETDAGSELEWTNIAQLRDELSYLGGNDLRVRVYTGRAEASVYYQIFVEAEKYQVGNVTYADGSVLPWANDGWGPGARVNWRLGADWTLFAQAVYRMRAYTVAAQPGSVAREDRETQLLTHVSRSLGPRLSSYLSLALVNNTSTLGSSSVKDENYSVQTGYLGIVYDLY